MHIITMQVYGILIESGFYKDLKVKEVDRRMTMVYEITTNELRLNPILVENFIEDSEMYYLYSEEEILNALVFHELGHYLEFKNNPMLISKAKYHQVQGSFKDYKDFCIEREKMAWKLGGEIIKDEYKEAFDYLNELNLKNYEMMKLKEV